MISTGRVAAIGLMVVVQSAGLHAQASAQVTLQLRDEPGFESVLAVMSNPLAGLPVDPFNYACVAYLELRSGNDVLSIDTTSIHRGVVRVGPASQSGSSAPYVRVTGLQRDLLNVLLEPREGEDLYVVRVDSARVLIGGAPTTVGPLETTPFAIPEEERARCGSVPEVDVQLLQPNDAGLSLSTKVDVVRRGILGNENRGGLWELWANGGFAPGESQVLLDSWTAGGRAEIQLTSGWEHWISLGLTGRVESDEEGDVWDRALGAELRVRLDFLGIDNIIRPFLAQFVPYPTVVLGYDRVSRMAAPDSLEALGEALSKHRLNGRLEWSAPLLFDTTLRIDWTGHLLLDDVPEGDERLKNLWDVRLEYPLIAGGDLVGTLALLDGSAPPLFKDFDKLLVGLGLRR